MSGSLDNSPKARKNKQIRVCVPAVDTGTHLKLSLAWLIFVYEFHQRRNLSHAMTTSWDSRAKH